MATCPANGFAHPARTWRKPRPLGLSARLVPSATARIAAAAASSLARRRLPPWLLFANFWLPAGSPTTRASAIAAVSSRLEAGVTLPSRHARLNALTSSPPSLKP